MSSLLDDWSIELFPSEQKLRRRRLSGATASQPANILETFLYFLGSDKHFSDSWLIGFKWTKEKKRSRNFNVFSSLFLIGGRWSLAFILLHFVLTMKKINKIVSMKLWRLFDHFVSILLVRLSCSRLADRGRSPDPWARTTGCQTACGLRSYSWKQNKIV